MNHRLTFRGLPAEGPWGSGPRGRLFPQLLPVPTGQMECCHMRASPRQHTETPIAWTLHWERLPVASTPLFPGGTRPLMTRLAHIHEGSPWRCAGEPSWFTPGASPSRGVLPAWATPITAAALVAKGIDEGFHRPADVASAVPCPRFWAMVSLACGHGSTQGPMDNPSLKHKTLLNYCPIRASRRGTPPQSPGRQPQLPAGVL